MSGPDRCARLLRSRAPMARRSTSGLLGPFRVAREAALQVVDVELDVVRRRVPGRQVFGLDLRPATGTIVLEDPTPPGVRREREAILLVVEDRPMDLLRLAVVDEQPALVVLASRAEILLTAPATPALFAELDLEILGDDDDAHDESPIAKSEGRSSPTPRSSRREGSRSSTVSRECTGR